MTRVLASAELIKYQAYSDTENNVYTCRVCNIEKAGSEFYFDARYKDGRGTICKSCKRQKLKKLRKDKKAEVKKAKKARLAVRDDRKVKLEELFNLLLELGFVIKPKACDGCGQISDRLQAEHFGATDLSLFLSVMWYCPECYVGPYRQDPKGQKWWLESLPDPSRP